MASHHQIWPSVHSVNLLLVTNQQSNKQIAKHAQAKGENLSTRYMSQLLSHNPFTEQKAVMLKGSEEKSTGPWRAGSILSHLLYKVKHARDFFITAHKEMNCLWQSFVTTVSTNI